MNQWEYFDLNFLSSTLHVVVLARNFVCVRYVQWLLRLEVAAWIVLYKVVQGQPIYQICEPLKQSIKALFTSRVFKRMRGNYFVFRNFPDRLFTSLGFEKIIP
jgi:hypothetical protein